MTILFLVVHISVHASSQKAVDMKGLGAWTSCSSSVLSLRLTFAPIHPQHWQYLFVPSFPLVMRVHPLLFTVFSFVS